MLPTENILSPQEMLDKVGEMKDKLFSGMFNDAVTQQILIEVDQFMQEHRIQILDILDDVYYAYVNGGKK